MTPQASTILLQVLVTLIGSGGLFGVFTLVQTRRKLSADADKVGVDATAVLTGEALDMVREARDQAKDAREQAKATADLARRTAAAADRRMDAMSAHIIKLERMVRMLGESPPPFAWPPDFDADPTG